MMSTIGRSPVIAAPTAIPVNPGSEMGVSSTRSVPNSSTSPVRTLNTVPASAMSSPQMKTRGSRRISSAIASRTASPNVSSRVSGINILIHLVWSWIRSSDGELNGLFHFRLYFGVDLIELSALGEVLGGHPIGQQFERIPLSLPHLFFLFRAVVLAADVADMMSQETIGLADQECRTGAGADTFNYFFRCAVHGLHVLSVHIFSLHSKSCSACQHIAGNRLGVVGVFVVEIVLADINHWQLPKRCHVHDLIEQPLSERAITEKADRDLSRPKTLG